MPVGEGGEEDLESLLYGPRQHPANVGTTSGLDPSSEAPESHVEATSVTGVEMSGSEGEPEPLPEFDPKVREDFDGLLYLGYLTDEFKWLGHSFTIRTVDIDTILEVGLLHKKYADSLADVKAYQALAVAACLTKLDGRPLGVPLSQGESDLEVRFATVRKWFSPTVDHVYQRSMLLEERVDRVIRAMGEARGSVGSTPSSTLASA